jgi:hypothetical protein
MLYPIVPRIAPSLIRILATAPTVTWQAAKRLWTAQEPSPHPSGNTATDAAGLRWSAEAVAPIVTQVTYPVA